MNEKLSSLKEHVQSQRNKGVWRVQAQFIVLSGKIWGIMSKGRKEVEKRSRFHIIKGVGCSGWSSVKPGYLRKTSKPGCHQNGVCRRSRWWHRLRMGQMGPSGEVRVGVLGLCAVVQSVHQTKVLAKEVSRIETQPRPCFPDCGLHQLKGKGPFL